MKHKAIFFNFKLNTQLQVMFLNFYFIFNQYNLHKMNKLLDTLTQSSKI